MPPIPRKEREVVTAPLPSGRLDVTVPDIGVSGAAVAGASLVEDIRLKELKSVNNTAVMAGMADATSRYTDALYNEESGFLVRENESAFNINSEAEEFNRTTRDELLASMGNDTQRELLTGHLNSLWANMDRNTKTHAVSERKNFQGEQVKNIALSEAAAAGQDYDNPERIGLAIGTYVQTWVEFAADNDISPDSAEYEAGLRNPVSGIHKSVINAMLADKQFADAREYHKENSEAIFNDDAIVKALKAGELEETATTKATEIIKQSGTGEVVEGSGLVVEGEGLTRTRANELIAGIEDPDNLPGLKASVRKKVDTYFKDRDAARKALSSESAEEAHIIMERPENEGRTTAEILEASYPSLWGRMNRTDKKAIEIRFNKPVPEENDRDAYLTFVDLASTDPEKVAAMDPSEFIIVSESFDKTHKARADALWRGAKEQVRKDETAGEKLPKTTNVLTAAQSAKQVWLGAGFPPPDAKATEELKAEYAQFLSNVDLVVSEESAREGRVLTAREEREAIDKVMRETVIPEMSDPGFIRRLFGGEPEPTGVVDVQGIEVSTFAGEIEEGEKILIQSPTGTGTLLATMGADGVLRAPHPETGESVPVDELRSTAGTVTRGTVIGGFEFTGGNPNDKKNWKKVE